MCGEGRQRERKRGRGWEVGEVRVRKLREEGVGKVRMWEGESEEETDVAR